MNYYPFHLGDYAAHTGHLEPMEDLAYRRMLDAYYLRETPLPFDPAEVARLIRMRQNMAEVEAVLREFFYMTDDGWGHARCNEEIERMQDKQAKARASAAASVNARRAKAQPVLNESKTNAEQTFNDRSTDVELPTPTPTPTPTPISIGESAIASQPPKPRPTRKCPFEFVVTDSLAVWAVENTPLVDIVASTAAFRDHTFKTAMTDWAGAWRNWMRRDQQYAAEKQKTPTAETVYQRSMRARVEEAAPSIARRAPTISQPDAADFFRTIATPGHVVDVKAIEVQP